MQRMTADLRVFEDRTAFVLVDGESFGIAYRKDVEVASGMDSPANAHRGALIYAMEVAHMRTTPSYL